jgi:hypothetical protein
MIMKDIVALLEAVASRTTSAPNTEEILRLEKKIMQGTAVLTRICELDLMLEAIGVPRKECGVLIYPIVERLTSLGKKGAPN